MTYDPREEIIGITEQEGAKPDESIAVLIRAFFVSKGFKDIFASTEVFDHEIGPLSSMLMMEFVTDILATDLADTMTDDPLYDRKLALKNKIENDPTAMMNLTYKGYLSAFAILRKSRKRQSTNEVVDILKSLLGGLTGGKSGSDVGLAQSLMSKMGFGKYDTNTTYTDKE